MSFVHGLLWCRGTLDKACHEEDADAAVRRALDAYIVFCMVVLACAYGLAAFAATKVGGIFGSVLIFVAAFVSGFRILEVLSVMAELHLVPVYEPRDSVRALVDALWNYVEIGLAFATMHVAAGFFAGNYGGDGPPTAFAPVYFSFVAMTTVGFGDYSPTRVFGQTLVVAEMLIGLVILVVVIQRAVATTLTWQRDNPPINPPAPNPNARQDST
jgi:hypothetical protein